MISNEEYQKRNNFEGTPPCCGCNCPIPDPCPCHEYLREPSEEEKNFLRPLTMAARHRFGYHMKLCNSLVVDLKDI